MRSRRSGISGTVKLVAEGAYALGDSKRPNAEPLRFTIAELNAAGIDPARFGLTA
ncbi:DUF397 domain-containing protein [Streptomyces griseocarneus]|nr:DUF397 domain-containing protein [Streptomyces griseocarneus]